MKRQTFLTIAAAVGALFSIVMIASPDKMMEGMGTTTSPVTTVVLQVVSVMLFSLSIITFLARKDEGSVALRAIIIGSIVMHLVLLPIDWIAYQKGIFTQISGIIPGTIVHFVLTAGFIYTLNNMGKK